MLYRSDFGQARVNDLVARARLTNGRAKHNPGPMLRVKLVVARRLVLIGASLHGTEPAVIGRVVILDECGQPPKSLRHAA